MDIMSILNRVLNHPTQINLYAESSFSALLPTTLCLLHTQPSGTIFFIPTSEFQLAGCYSLPLLQQLQKGAILFAKRFIKHKPKNLEIYFWVLQVLPILTGRLTKTGRIACANWADFWLYELVLWGPHTGPNRFQQEESTWEPCKQNHGPVFKMQHQNWQRTNSWEFANARRSTRNRHVLRGKCKSCTNANLPKI